MATNHDLEVINICYYHAIGTDCLPKSEKRKKGWQTIDLLMTEVHTIDQPHIIIWIKGCQTG